MPHQIYPSRQAALSTGASLSLTALVLLVILAMHGAAAAQTATNQPPTNRMTDNQTSTIETVTFAGRQIEVDAQTGRVKRPMTQDEARELAAGVKEFFNSSNFNLKRETQINSQASGTEINLDGRFYTAAFARISDSGEVETECVTSPEAAAKFLGVEVEAALQQINEQETLQQKSSSPTPLKSQVNSTDATKTITTAPSVAAPRKASAPLRARRP